MSSSSPRATPWASCPRWTSRAPPPASDMAPVTAADAVLIDGATVGVRPVRPEDEPALAALLGGMSDRSRWLRFFSATADLGAAARQAAGGPGAGGVVAVAGEGGEIVGHALYVRAGAHRAEIAFEVADAWQGRGVGTIL